MHDWIETFSITRKNILTIFPFWVVAFERKPWCPRNHTPKSLQMSASNSVESVCDKCGQVILPGNNLGLFLTLYIDECIKRGVDAGIHPLATIGVYRHLLPVTEGDRVICEGSPSRAQHLKGQPRDTRGYPYRPKHQSAYRAAYRALLAKAADGITQS